MKLYIVRHAIAEDRVKFHSEHWDDNLRPLTDQGKNKFKKIAKHLFKLIGPVDVIISSPLLRAKQTANLLLKHYPGTQVLTAAELTPTSDPSHFAKWCKKNLNTKCSRILIVGHEPHLSKLTSWLIFGTKKSCVNIKKGGCLSLAIGGSIGPNSGVIEWALTPKSIGL